jgi:uracil-DNA glycosylase
MTSDELKKIMKVNLWEELHDCLEKSRFDEVYKMIQYDIKRGAEVYPSPHNICNAYKYVTPDKVKVVIIGQDPYHNGIATGLAFGVKNYKTIPPSLRNIFKELCDQYNHNVSQDDFDFSLEHWAKQGVMLLNTSLTVRKGGPGSHFEMWDFLIIPTLELIQSQSPDAVYIMWGRHAQRYQYRISDDKVKLFAAHPAAESYKQDAGFYGNGHFVKVNEILKEKIDWFS